MGAGGARPSREGSLGPIEAGSMREWADARSAVRPEMACLRQQYGVRDAACPISTG